MRSVLWLILVTPTLSATTQLGKRTRRTDLSLQRPPQSKSANTTHSKTNKGLPDWKCLMTTRHIAELTDQLNSHAVPVFLLTLTCIFVLDFKKIKTSKTFVLLKISVSIGFSSGSGPGTKFLYFQMELCEGDTLRAWIDKRNSSNEHFLERRADAAQISRQVLTAVAYIHSEGLIHRDLKVSTSLKWAYIRLGQNSELKGSWIDNINVDI